MAPDQPSSPVSDPAHGAAAQTAHATHSALATQSSPRRDRSRLVGRDMLLSMGLVALALGVWMFFAHPHAPDGIHTVAWYPTAQSATQSASYDVLAPPTSFAWSATSARVEPQPDGTVVWRVGFYTPDSEYAGLLQRGEFPEQAQGSIDEWLAEETRNGEPAGQPVSLGGREWERLEGDSTPDERRSLVTRDHGTVIVVTGSAQWPELEQLASSLRPLAG